MKEFPPLVQESPNIASQEFPPLSAQDSPAQDSPAQNSVVASFGDVDADLLLNQLQQLEETLHQHMQTKYLQENIWNLEWDIHQRESILRQSQQEFEKQQLQKTLEHKRQNDQIRQQWELEVDMKEKCFLQEKQQQQQKQIKLQQEQMRQKWEEERQQQGQEKQQEGEKRKKKNSKERKRMKKRKEEEEKREQEEKDNQKMKKILDTRFDWAESWERGEAMEFGPLVF